MKCSSRWLCSIVKAACTSLLPLHIFRAAISFNIAIAKSAMKLFFLVRNSLLLLVLQHNFLLLFMFAVVIVEPTAYLKFSTVLLIFYSKRNDAEKFLSGACPSQRFKKGNKTFVIFYILRQDTSS